MKKKKRIILDDFLVYGILGKIPLEQGKAAQFSVIAWRIKRREEPGGLQSTGSQRIRDNWATNTLVHNYPFKIPALNLKTLLLFYTGSIYKVASPTFSQWYRCFGGLPRWLSSKESAWVDCGAGAAGDRGLIPGSGTSPGGGNGNSVQYYCLDNPMDRGTW